MGIEVLFALAALAQDAAPPSPPPASQPLVMTGGYDDKFFLQDQAGENRLEIGGLLQVNATFFERGLHGRDSDVFLRRFRLEIGGRIDGDWLFNFEPKFTEHDFDMEEAWIGCEPESGLLAMAGRMKEPFSFEEERPVKHVAFVNLSLMNQYVPAEGHGLTLHGRPRDGAWEWGAAIYQGGEEGMNGGSEGAGRLVVRPFSNGAPAWRRLQFGAAATVGRNDDPLGGVDWITEARVPFATLDPLAEADGEHLRLGVEAAWWTGPVELSAEWMHNELQVEGPLGEEDAVTQVWYGALAWVVTGEERTIKAVRPARPFELRGARGPGAVELAARVTRLQVGEGWSESGVLPAGSDPRRVTCFDVGVNWYLTWHARAKLHGLLTQYSEPVVIGGDAIRDELALLLQLQLHF